MAADTTPGAGPGRLKRLAGVDWKARARQAASSLKAEYEAGKQGDDSPTTPIWATPHQQLESLLATFKLAPTGEHSNGAVADPSTPDADVEPAAGQVGDDAAIDA